MNQRDKVIQIAQAEVGKNKGGNKFWKAYGFANHVEWCACFVSYVLLQAGLEMVDRRQHYNDYNKYDGQGLYTATCVSMESWLEKHGHRTSADDMPQPGDIVFYDWDPSGKNGVDHVGICEKVEGKNADDAIMTVIEGNKSVNGSDNVGRRVIAYRAKDVAATCRPDYREIPDPEPEHKVYNEKVANLEFHLGCNIDGYWDDKVVTACDKQTLKNGSKGFVVKFLQICLNGFGLTTEVDGEYGPLTEKAVRAYQGKNSLTVDGKVGSDTWARICGVK